ncbi:unnamed protein product [Rotaria sp. Silwood2]|nr:unnamed protein product [Rotaria sp. Silwood2]CAF3067457.1 unnamed protein product [Rotaria sp. Silwood2]CAF3963544.1 unnamed protein product [Rotaria sp. Silwood2]CAF3977486.1 unnamed protein product [Rotaria sp. Silwood2]
MAEISTFDMLPDEMLLHICQYLRCADILYGFYNLNTRLNITIIDFCRHVNITGVQYKQFQYVVLKILPEIGSSIRSIVYHGNWQTVVSDQIRSLLFCSNLSMIFSQLHTLILACFTGEQLFTFLDAIKDLVQLVKLDIYCLEGKVPEELLRKILSANDGRLKSISFDQDSIDLILTEAQHDQPISYTNIEELTIGLMKSEALECLFTLVPNITRLHVTFDDTSNLLIENINGVPFLIHLKDFQLRSMDTYWTFDKISDILTKMPSLRKLALDLSTEDACLVNGDNFATILPASLVNLNLFIIYVLPESYNQLNNLPVTWPSHIPIACLLNECHRYAIIHTIPCDLSSIVIAAQISKQMLTGWKYMQKVKHLKIYGKASFTDIPIILQHFRQLRTLKIDVDWNSEACM